MYILVHFRQNKLFKIFLWFVGLNCIFAFIKIGLVWSAWLLHSKRFLCLFSLWFFGLIAFLHSSKLVLFDLLNFYTPKGFHVYFSCGFLDLIAFLPSSKFASIVAPKKGFYAYFSQKVSLRIGETLYCATTTCHNAFCPVVICGQAKAKKSQRKKRQTRVIGDV